MYAIYMVTFTINIPPMLAYIPAPWIRHGLWQQTVANSARKVHCQSIVGQSPHHNSHVGW